MAKPVHPHSVRITGMAPDPVPAHFVALRRIEHTAPDIYVGNRVAGGVAPVASHPAVDQRVKPSRTYSSSVFSAVAGARQPPAPRRRRSAPCDCWWYGLGAGKFTHMAAKAQQHRLDAGAGIGLAAAIGPHLDLLGRQRSCAHRSSAAGPMGTRRNRSLFLGSPGVLAGDHRAIRDVDPLEQSGQREADRRPLVQHRQR
jgi:hypothetical protein